MQSHLPTIRKRRLAREVTITAPSATGFRSGAITFKPLPPGSGWQWHGKPLQQVDAQKVFRSIQLRHVEDVGQGRKVPSTVNVAEHIVPPLFMGLTDVEFHVTGSPHFSRTQPLWEALEKNSGLARDGFTWYTPCKSVRGHINGNRWDRYIQIDPNLERSLDIFIVVNYPEIGPAHRKRFVLPDVATLKESFETNPLGRFPFESIIRRLTFMPIVREAHWARDYRSNDECKKLLDLICLHRLTDILGALPFCIPPDGMLSAHITSFCGGHEGDMKAVHQLRESGALQPLMRRAA